MKSLSEIFQLIKIEYVEGKYPDKINGGLSPHLGMCSAVESLVKKGKLTIKDEERFDTEYWKFIRNRKVFYDYNGDRVSNKLQFAWDPKNRPARIKWLNQRI